MGVVAVPLLVTVVIIAVGIFHKQKKKESTKQAEPMELRRQGNDLPR